MAESMRNLWPAVDDTAQRDAAAANQPDYTRRSPMDLVCRQIPNHDGSFDYLVGLPNPRHPFPPTPPVLHHGQHDPTTSLSWGYRGAGPADLALNVMAAYFPLEREAGDAGHPSGALRTWDGAVVSAQAERLHKAFEKDVVARIPAVGGVVPEAEIRSWIERESATSTS